MLAGLKWFLRWYRRRGLQAKILVALLILVTFMGCFGVLTPSFGTFRSGPAPTPAPTSKPAAAVAFSP